MNTLALQTIAEERGIDREPSVSWLSRQVLRGHNVHHDRTVVCVRIRLGEWRGRSTSTLPARVIDESVARFVTDARVPPTAPLPQTLEAMLRSAEGMPVEQLLLECLLITERRLALWRQDFIPIGKADVRHVGDDGDGIVEVVWSSAEPGISANASRLVVAELDRLLASALSTQELPTDSLDAEYTRLVERCRRKEVPRSAALMLLAANARGMHAEVTGGANVQFGQGALQRRAHASGAGRESMPAIVLLSNKARTTTRLSQLGFPVPRHAIAKTLEAATKAATRIGFPLVVKPLRGTHGQGVTVGVRNVDDLASALALAQESVNAAVIEEFVPGAMHRLLVIDGRFASAIRLDLPAAEESSPQTAATLTSGSRWTAVSDSVHPAHARLAERAAAALGLRIAGVDMVCTDIAMDPDAAATRIIGVSARPGLFAHCFPQAGVPRDVAAQLLDMIYPAPATGRVPALLVVGRRGSLATSNAIAAELGARGVRAGLASRQRCSVAGTVIEEGDLTLYESVARLWCDDRVETLVGAIDPGRAVSTGLVFDIVDIACLLPRDAADDEHDFEAAVALAVAACRGSIVVRQGDAGVMPALDEACRKGILRRDAIHVLPEGATAADIASAVADLCGRAKAGGAS